MPDLKDCITSAMADGHISREAGADYIERFDELAEAIGGGSGRSHFEAKAEAAIRLQAEMERKIRRKKRMRLFHARATDSLRARAAAAAGKTDGAMKAALDFDPSLEHVGPNVSMRHESLKGSAFSMMSEFVDNFRSKAAGFTRETAGMGDVVKGLFGEKTTPEAKAFADAVQEARQFLVGRHNSSGGDILRRRDWGWVQRHDRAEVAAVAKGVWVDYVLARLDPHRMLNEAGEAMTERELRSVVESSYDSILLGGIDDVAVDPKFGSPVNKRITHRELVFTDSKAWLEYQERFGAGDMFGSIVGEIDRLARDVAVIEVLGPYPRLALETMKELIDADRGARAIEAGGARGKLARKLSDAIGKHHMLDAIYDQVTGQANIPADSGWARASQSNRNLVTSARLGSAIFVATGDVSTMTLTAKMNGLSSAKVLARFVSLMNPANKADRRMAARAGYIAETWTGHAVGAARLMGEVTGAPSTARITDTVLRMSGLNAWTDSARAAFKLEFIGHLTDNANKAFHRLDDPLRAALERHGIDAADWKLYTDTPIWRDAETGAEFIRPEDVWRELVGVSGASAEHRARFDAAAKFNAMVATEGLFAVIMPTARSRALTTGGTAPGSFWGEVIRNAVLFRSFAVTFALMHGSRMMAQRGIASKGKYAAHLFIGMTLAGAFAEQASSIARGKDPKDMTDPKFWAGAVIRGGSLGPLGDFLYSSTSRHGNTLAEGLLGPVLGGQLVAGAKFSLGNIQELIATGEAKNVVPELRRFADGLMPGRSLWYARGAFERLVEDELEMMLDPNANARFRRIEKRARRDFDQKFFSRPGRGLPQRAPDLSKAVGG